MRRNWNVAVWVGFGVTLLAVFSYIPLFSRFPVTRDFPWVNLLLFVVGGSLLAAGLRRAFCQSGYYRGKVSGVILSVLSLFLFGLFCYGSFYVARNIPPAEGALTVGKRAPDFMLAGLDGKQVALSQLAQGKRAVLLIFYRGYW